ncbi:MAG TPA: IclR family transcriptional regulator [Nevskia sp.]|nr:IclR family transcriptional regulator [Nevskia sp.]
MKQTRKPGVPDASGTAQAAPRIEEDTGGGPRALSRVLRILDQLAGSASGLSLAGLSVSLGSPKSSLLNLLRPLVADGYLSLAGGHYRLAPRAFRLGARIVARWSFPQVVQSHLEKLWQKTGESVALAVMDAEAERVTFVSVIDSLQPVRYALSVGLSAHLYCTAAGRLLLAHAEEEWRERYLRNAGFKAYTPRTVTDPAVLRAILEWIRVHGYSVSIGESMPRSGAIAAPVLSPDGKVAAAMVVGAPADRLEAGLEELRDALLDAATRASGTH